MSLKSQSLSGAYLTSHPYLLVCPVPAFLPRAESWTRNQVWSRDFWSTGHNHQQAVHLVEPRFPHLWNSGNKQPQRVLVRTGEITCWKGKCFADVSYCCFSACQPCSVSASWHWKIQLRALLVLAFVCSVGHVHPRCLLRFLTQSTPWLLQPSLLVALFPCFPVHFPRVPRSGLIPPCFLPLHSCLHPGPLRSCSVCKLYLCVLTMLLCQLPPVPCHSWVFAV